MGNYEVVGHTCGSVRKEGVVYSVRGGNIILRVADRGEPLDKSLALCCADMPQISEEGRKLPRNRKDVLFQSGVVLS